jgi:hypothetical protein
MTLAQVFALADSIYCPVARARGRAKRPIGIVVMLCDC